jgi:3-dehydroquinate dehydratase-1
MENDQQLIVIGMGELGKRVRIISPLFGGYLTYAWVKKNKTAPGQMSLKEMKAIYDKLLI